MPLVWTLGISQLEAAPLRLDLWSLMPAASRPQREPPGIQLCHPKHPVRALRPAESLLSLQVPATCLQQMQDPPRSTGDKRAPLAETSFGTGSRWLQPGVNRIAMSLHSVRAWKRGLRKRYAKGIGAWGGGAGVSQVVWCYQREISGGAWWQQGLPAEAHDAHAAMDEIGINLFLTLISDFGSSLQ